MDSLDVISWGVVLILLLSFLSSSIHLLGVGWKVISWMRRKRQPIQKLSSDWFNEPEHMDIPRRISLSPMQFDRDTEQSHYS